MEKTEAYRSRRTSKSNLKIDKSKDRVSLERKKREIRPKLRLAFKPRNEESQQSLPSREWLYTRFHRRGPYRLQVTKVVLLQIRIALIYSKVVKVGEEAVNPLSQDPSSLVEKVILGGERDGEKNTTKSDRES